MEQEKNAVLQKDGQINLVVQKGEVRQNKRHRAGKSHWMINLPLPECLKVSKCAMPLAARLELLTRICLFKAL